MLCALLLLLLCCCCMLRVRARVVARPTTAATPLLWLLLLNWMYSCAPLWAGACVVAFPPTHFACCVCCGCCEEEQTTNMPERCTWSSLPTNAPTHQEEQKRLPQHTHFNVNNLIMKLKLMSRVLAWNSIISVHVFLRPRTLQPHSGKLSDDACAIRHCSGDVG